MEYGPEKILPYNNDEQKSTQVRRMFDSIAGTYDLLNHALSFGIDKGWRKKGISFLKPYAPSEVLDLATGTGDLAISIYKMLAPDKIIGADISEGMMDVGRKKVADLGLSSTILFEQQDCLNLSYEENSFDAITAAFGVRNFENLEKGLTDILRTLKPGGQLIILETSVPTQFPFKQGYYVYTNFIMPTIGKLFSKDKKAYQYLSTSAQNFPFGEALNNILRKIGFIDVKHLPQTFGVATIYQASKK